MEQWHNLAHLGFPEYAVSTFGNVRNERTLRNLRQTTNQSGVPKVGLVRTPGEPSTSLSVALLVAETFIERPEPQEAFNTPINIDGDRFNNHVDNLAWRPRWYAIRYVQQFKKPEDRHPVVCIDTDEHFPSVRQAAKHFGVLEQHILSSMINFEPVWLLNYDFRRARD